MQTLKYTVLIAIMFTTILLAACGGNGDSTGSGKPGSDVFGLELPTAINVFSANVESNTNIASASANIYPLDATDPGTDYSNAGVLHYTDLEGTQNFDTVNSILCILDKLNYREMVNTGTYTKHLLEDICYPKAIVDENNRSTFELIFTIDSSRQDNNSPHIVRLWVELPYSDLNSTDPAALPAIELIELTIHQGITDSSPFGIFDTNLLIIVDASIEGGELGQAMEYQGSYFRSLLSNDGKPRFEFKGQSGEDLSESSLAYTSTFESITQLDSSFSGQSINQFSATDTDSTRTFIDVASFNDNYILFRSVENDAPVDKCFSRNTYIDSVLDYHLFHNADSIFRNNNVTAGQLVTHSAPLIFNYTHNALNDRINTDPLTNPIHNRVFNLRYENDILLGRYWSEQGEILLQTLELRDGTLLSNDEGEFLVKAVGILHEILEVNTANCNVLSVDNILSNPEFDTALLPDFNADSISWRNIRP